MKIDHELAPDAAPVLSTEDPSSWPTITDEIMLESLAATRPYTLVILKPGPNYSVPGAREIIWEHGRRNMSMRAAGLMPLIFPIPGGGEVCGVGIFNSDPEAVQ